MNTDLFFKVLTVAITLCCIGIPIVVACFVFRYQTSSRDQLHHERLAAIKAGIDPHIGNEVSASEPYRNQAFWIAFWMVVCGCGASFVSVGRWVDSDTDSRIATVAWFAAGLASVVASMAASLLMIKAKPR